MCEKNRVGLDVAVREVGGKSVLVMSVVALRKRTRQAKPTGTGKKAC